ncbi:MAG: type II secretion system protein [Lachnospirales bacterium]
MDKIKRKGFTLVELIVVIVIMGIMSAFAVPALANYVSETKGIANQDEFDMVYKGVLSGLTDYDDDLGEIIPDDKFIENGTVVVDTSKNLAQLGDLSVATADKIISAYITENVTDFVELGTGTDADYKVTITYANKNVSNILIENNTYKAENGGTVVKK